MYARLVSSATLCSYRFICNVKKTVAFLFSLLAVCSVLFAVFFALPRNSPVCKRATEFGRGIFISGFSGPIDPARVLGFPRSPNTVFQRKPTFLHLQTRRNALRECCNGKMLHRAETTGPQTNRTETERAKRLTNVFQFLPNSTTTNASQRPQGW